MTFSQINKLLREKEENLLNIFFWIISLKFCIFCYFSFEAFFYKDYIGGEAVNFGVQFFVLRNKNIYD